MDSILHRLVVLLFLIDIWQKDGESSLRCLIKRVLHFIYIISFLTFFLTCAVRSDNAGEKCFLANCTLLVAITTLKAYFIIWKKEEILTFLCDYIVSHDCLTDQEESVEVAKKMKKVEKFSLNYIKLLLFTLLSFVIFPLFNVEKTLPGFITFQSDSEYATIFYYVAYAHLTLCAILGYIYCFLMLFIWYIMWNYAIEYKLIGNRFKRLGGATYHRDLIASISAHRNLFGYLDYI